MKVLVDYTNNKGERALREIEPWQSFGPTQFTLAFDFIPIEGDDDRKFEKTLPLRVSHANLSCHLPYRPYNTL